MLTNNFAFFYGFVQKRKRGASKGEFIEEKGERNKFSKYQLESLERKVSIV